MHESIQNNEIRKTTLFDYIPNDWKVIKFEDIADKEIKWSITGGPFGSNLKADEYTSSGVRIIQLQNIGDGIFKNNYKIYTSQEKADELLSCNIYPDELILSKMGDPVARTCVIPNSSKRFLMSSDGIRLVVNTKKFDKLFILNYINASFFRRRAIRVSIGTTRKRIGLSDLKNIQILCPPKTEQKKIAEILSTWDTAIEQTKKLKEAKMKRKHSLMQRLLTGKKRFPSFVKSKERFEGKYFTLPKDWNFVKIGDVAKDVSKKNKSGESITVLSCTKHHGLVDSLSYFGKQMFSKNLSTYKIVKRGEFAYATNHIEEGSIGYQDLYDKALISPMYTVFKVDENVNHSYLFKLVKTETYRQIFEINTNGSINRRGALRWKDFANISIPLPSYEEQERIAKTFDICDKEIELLDKKIEALKEQKRGLMQKLLTGKVRVKVEKNGGGV